MNLAHIELALISFFKQNPDVVLDGELYNHKLKNDFEKIISLVRKQKPTADDRLNAQHLVQFHVYDYFDGVMYDSYKTRMQQLACSDIYDAQIKHVPTLLVDTYSYARLLHEEFLEDGYEGSIIRLNGLYKHGRSYDLMKFKDFSDAEATIVGYELGKGKRTGTLGKFLMMDDEGVSVSVQPLPIFKEHKRVHTDIRYLNVLEIMSKLIWQLYNDNMISYEVANLLLDKHYNRLEHKRYK